MNTNSFSNPPYLVVGTAWERCLFLSQFWSRVLNSFISASLNCSSECKDCNWKRSSGQFYCYHSEAVQLQSNWVTIKSSRSPSTYCELCTRSPFLWTLVQLTLSENQVPGVQARSFCEWLRQSKCHAEHGYSEAVNAEPTGQKQPLSSSGLAQRWLQQEQQSDQSHKACSVTFPHCKIHSNCNVVGMASKKQQVDENLYHLNFTPLFWQGKTLSEFLQMFSSR